MTVRKMTVSIMTVSIMTACIRTNLDTQHNFMSNRMPPCTGLLSVIIPNIVMMSVLAPKNFQS